MTKNFRLDSAEYRARAINLAIAEAIAYGYSTVMAGEARRAPKSTTDAASLTSVRRGQLGELVLTRLVRGKLQPRALSASATLTTRGDLNFIPASLALRIAIQRGGGYPSGRFLVNKSWVGSQA